MRILQYRTTWAWGCGKWEYKTISDADELKESWGYKNTKEYLEHEVFEYIHRDHNYSDKYRGLEYNILYPKRLSKKIREVLIKKYKDSLKYAKSSVLYYDDLIKELSENSTSDTA